MVGSGDGERDASVHGKRSGTDPRVVVSRERVLTATLDLLTEAGLGGLTFDDVAKRSGVAKTTIYRHWPNRKALIIDACLRMTDGEDEPPDTGSLEGDVTAILTNLAELLVTARWSSILPSIVDAAERDPEIAEVHSRLQRWHAAPLRAALERAARRGEIAPEVDLERDRCCFARTALFPPLVLSRSDQRQFCEPDRAERPRGRAAPPSRAMRPRRPPALAALSVTGWRPAAAQACRRAGTGYPRPR